MLSFESDYTEGAHEKILQRFMETNREQACGYGFDPYCESAKKKICEECGCPNADIYFLVGGTQTNQVVISSVLRSYEGVVALKTGHVSAHEAGAIEYTGHKVLELFSEKETADGRPDGKMYADDLEKYLKAFYEDENHEHMVFPGMVYISHPTEYGTLYTKDELRNLSIICRKYHIPLYLDGARLGYGLMSSDTDVDLKVIAEYCDMFYIGGTKVGALCGEAVVFPRHNAPEHFMTQVKQHGALLAKGRVLGIQFDALFTDGLYYEISRTADQLAEQLKKELIRKGYQLYINSPTNQQFVVLENQKMEQLKQHVRFGFWEQLDSSHTVVRFATSWATTQADIDQLLEFL